MSRVTREQVAAIMGNPPRWLWASYIAPYKSGRYSLEDLAYGVVAALRMSAYDQAAVDEVAGILEHLGYGDEVAAVWM